MLSKTELFDGVQSFSPRQRVIYQIGLVLFLVALFVLSAGVIIGLSILLAYWLIDPEVSTEVLMSVTVVPGVMCLLFVAAGTERTYNTSMNKPEAMRRTGWRGLRAGFLTGVVVVALVHFLSQLIMARALYGRVHFSRSITAYCGPLPVLYGILFAIPIALGCGLFAAGMEIGEQVVYEWVSSQGEKKA